MTVKAIIVDDEPLARIELRRLLQPHAGVEVVGEARDMEEALALLNNTPDLMFLDIEMPGGNGFDLLERLGADVPQVIFTTAYERHAVQAFEVNALDYLLKPIAPERLAHALQRVSTAPTRRARLFLRDGGQCWIVNTSEVTLFESDGNYTRVHVRGCRPLVRRSLNMIEPSLDPGRFFRVNRQQIVNLDAVERTHVDPDGMFVLHLHGGAVVAVSRRRSELLRARLAP